MAYSLRSQTRLLLCRKRANTTSRGYLKASIPLRKTLWAGGTARLSGASGQSDGGAGDDAVGASWRVAALLAPVATGPTGTLMGQEDHNRNYIEYIEESTALLAMVHLDVIVLAHRASSYTLGCQGETALLARLEKLSGTRVITAFGAVIQALEHLRVHKIALGIPYAKDTSLKSKAHLEAHGLQVVGFGRLDDVQNIYRRPRKTSPFRAGI